jgi:multiple sugar transport system ATP-binding protein
MAQADESDTKISDGNLSSTEQRGLTIENLKKTFDDGTVVAAEDINIDMAPDEFVVLLGPSGCGKTTTLRCIAGLEDSDEGRILIGEEDITRRKPKDRDLAFVFQSIALFPHMTVRENMRFGLDMKTDLSPDEKEERVQRAAEVLGIGTMLDRKPTELSGGQQQRVSIGRAMVMEPNAFLLDEPFSNLDANLRDQMQTEVKRLNRQLETTMIFVTHDQEEAMTLGDKIVIMKSGRIQQIGTPYEIYNDPENEFIANFIGSPSTNIIDCTIEGSGDNLRLTSDVISFPVPEDKVTQLEEYAGEDLRMGIRPEYLSLTDPGKGYFDADVALIEPKGSHDDIELRTGGPSLRVTADQGEVSQEEIPTGVNVETEHVWVFAEDGTRLI